MYREEVDYVRSLLIVDDQPGIRFLLEEFFRSEGYSISLAKMVWKLLKKLRRNNQTVYFWI